MTYWLQLGLNVFPCYIMRIDRNRVDRTIHITVQLKDYPDVPEFEVPSKYVVDEAGKQVL